MDVQKLKNESGLKGSNSSEMASALRNFGQAASNNIAETVSVPVDAIAWALRKAGVPVGDAPVMGSEWMAQKGLTRPTQEGVSKMAGDFVGLVSPLAFEKQVASKLAGALRNVKPSAGLSTEAVGGMDFLKPEYLYHGTSPEAAKAIDKSGFDLTKSADGTVWFTSNPNIGEVAASNKGAIIKRQLPKDIKLGGWDEMDKYSTDELLNMGYHGLKLPDGGEITYQIFNPEKLAK